ncbi:hypothetical protein LMG19282_05345 [Cupriavidus campinensis]|uniref:DUF3306 domain-containing protein n=1 Tax=Cupriavidus campinensis TaxID=151783 RepID=A0ABY3ENA5_9BURK|nr:MULTISPECIES: DUF3306 domain-containing protein [Cupriavidus]TSP12365.1 DUF3306 domain-containing protein [Cupriavidus campinensis]CAG2156928.1 hypothetical protein LMG19282_05345 [Cupriavidus campinensis]
MSDADSSFLSRWSRRKAAVREGQPVPAEPVLAPDAAPVAVTVAKVPTAPPADPQEAALLPTLADVALLQPGDNIARFVARGVDETVKRAALKTLFADPHFNVMDGLDTYIDDYGKPDPIPLDVLRRLTQSETLGLFDPIEDEERQGEKEEEGEVAADPKALEAPPSPPSPEAEVAQAQPQPDAPADDTPIPPLPADKRA